MVRRLLPLVLLAGLALAPAALAAPVVAIKGAPAPGPAKYDRVSVEQHGPTSAKTVLVLIPGTGGGAGSVAPVAADLAARVKSLQVWAFDRREQAFEDTSGFRTGDPDAAADYYLGFKYKRVLAEDDRPHRRRGGAGGPHPRAALTHPQPSDRRCKRHHEPPRSGTRRARHQPLHPHCRGLPTRGAAEPSLSRGCSRPRRA